MSARGTEGSNPASSSEESVANLTFKHLEQEVIVNHTGSHDGVLRVWIDGRLAANWTDVLYRVADNVSVAGLMFSTFFGGHDPSWASPRAQSIFFRNFQFFGSAEAQ